MFFFLYFSSFPISKKKLKVFTCINKRFCTLFRLWWGQRNPPGTTGTCIRALLSRSSGEMKFDSSSCMLKPVYFAFVKTMLEFFFCKLHILLNHEQIRQDQRAKQSLWWLWDAPFWRRQTLWWASMHIARSAVAHAHAKKTPVATEAFYVNCLRSVPAFAGCFLELNDVYWVLRCTDMFFMVSWYF